MKGIKNFTCLKFTTAAALLLSSCAPVYKLDSFSTRSAGDKSPLAYVTFKPYRNLSIWTKKRAAGDTTFFFGSFAIHDDDTTKHIKLSAIQLSLSDYPPDGKAYAFSMMRIAKRTHTPGTSYDVLTPDDALQRTGAIALADGHPRHFNFWFYKINPEHLSHQIQLYAEATFEENGQVKTEQCAIIYKKRLHSYPEW